MESNFFAGYDAVIFHLDAQVEDALNLGLYISFGRRSSGMACAFCRQPVGTFEDGHLVPVQGQLPGCRKPPTPTR